MTYDFLLHQTTTMELSEHSKKQLGLGAAVVTHLSQHISRANHKPFISDNVLEVLAKKKIHAAGTAKPQNLHYTLKKTCQKRTVQTLMKLWIVMERWSLSNGLTIKWLSWCLTLLVLVLWMKCNSRTKISEGLSSSGCTMKQWEVLTHWINLSVCKDCNSVHWEWSPMTHTFWPGIINSWLEYKLDTKRAKIPEKDTASPGY